MSCARREGRSTPVIAIQRAVLDGFGEVLGGDGGGLVEVGDGAGDFEDAVVGAGGEAHAADGHFEGALAGVVEGADAADIAGGHAGVVEAARAAGASRACSTRARISGGGFGGGVAAQFLEGNGGDFDVDIDAVEQRAADLAEVVLDLAGRAAAFAGGIAVEAALAGIHGGHQHEAGGEAERHGGAGDAERAIFQRLAEHFENVARKLREFVEEEHAVVRQADFAGTRHAGAAADQAGVGDGVVRRAERALVQQSGARPERAGDAVDFGGFDGLFEGEGRQDAGEALGEHGLAGAGRADHQDVVDSGGGDFEGALGHGLAAHVAEIGRRLGFGGMAVARGDGG